MANKERGELAVTVGGKSYTLRPTFDSLCELESQVDKPIDVILAGVQEGRISGLRAVVWCLLQDQHGEEIKTLKDASAWIEQAGGVSAALDMVSRAMGLNSNTGDSAPNPPVAQTDGTGEPSKLEPAASV
jgi:hypothetical protein